MVPWSLLGAANASFTELLAAVVVVLAFLLSSSTQRNFQRVGKSWLLSTLSGRDAMSWTMEKHIQKGYDEVNVLSMGISTETD
jgi:hypothetical protein